MYDIWDILSEAWFGTFVYYVTYLAEALQSLL